MTIDAIANRYVSLCKAGHFDQALELFSEDAVSVEASAPPGMEREARGLAAIRAKGDSWSKNHTIHSFDASDWFPNGDRFAVIFDLDVTNNPSGQRMQMREVGLFTVQNGKITREEFFYRAG